MKGRPKPYRQRKIYKRKSGGGKFFFSGRTNYPSPISTLNFGKIQQTVNPLSFLLEKMGFNVKH